MGQKLYLQSTTCFHGTQSYIFIFYYFKASGTGLHSIWHHPSTASLHLTSPFHSFTPSDITLPQLHSIWHHPSTASLHLTSPFHSFTPSDITLPQLHSIWHHPSTASLHLTSPFHSFTPSDITLPQSDMCQTAHPPSQILLQTLSVWQAQPGFSPTFIFYLAGLHPTQFGCTSMLSA